MTIQAVRSRVDQNYQQNLKFRTRSVRLCQMIRWCICNQLSCCGSQNTRVAVYKVYSLDILCVWKYSERGTFVCFETSLCVVLTSAWICFLRY